MIETSRQGLRDDGFEVSISKLCRWFDVPRRSYYYRSLKSAPRINSELEAPVKALIKQEPSFDYRTVAWWLGMNKNTVQRIFQHRGWQVHKRATGARPRIQALLSIAMAPDERWETEPCVAKTVG